MTPSAARHGGKVLVHLADIARVLSFRNVDELLDSLPRGRGSATAYMTTVTSRSGRTDYISAAGVDYLLSQLYKIENMVGGCVLDQDLDAIIEGLPAPARANAQRRVKVDCSPSSWGRGDTGAADPSDYIRVVDIFLPRYGIVVLLSGISSGSDVLRRKYKVVTGGARLLQTIGRINTAILEAVSGC